MCDTDSSDEEVITARASAASLAASNDAAFEEKSAALRESLANRFSARHAELSSKWEARKAETSGPSSELPSTFWKDWEGEKSRVESACKLLVAATSPGSEEATDGLAALTSDIKAAHERIADATKFLPPYDVKRALTEVEELSLKVEATRGKLVPRKKFAFGSRKKKAVAAGTVPPREIAGS